MRLIDPSKKDSDSSFDGTKPTMALKKTPFLSVTMASNTLTTMYDGYVGLAPYTHSKTVRDINHNFMYNLKHNLGVIDHMIASVFITSNGKSSVKFGSYDQQALKNGT